MESLIALMKHMRDNKEREEKGMKMKKLKRLLAGVMTAAMVMSTMAMTAFAEDESLNTITGTPNVGSLTIIKHKETKEEVLPGVTFTVYKLAGITVEDGNVNVTINDKIPVKDGEQRITVDELERIANEEDNSEAEWAAVSSKINFDSDNMKEFQVDAKTTGEDGKVTFSGLSLGIYAVAETDAPAQVVSKSANFIVSIPMTDATGDSWVYDITAEPKNTVALGGVTLVKRGQIGNGTATALDGAKFVLQKYENGSWVAAKDTSGTEVGELTTADGGNINVQDLPYGTYRFIEISVGNGYIMDGATTYEFEITTDNKVKYNGEELGEGGVIEVINHKPDLDKEVNTKADGNGEWQEAADYSVGDKVPYQITVTIPKNIAKLKKFNVKDTPTNLRDDLDSIKVNVGDVTLITNEDYTVTKESEGFLIQFVPTKLEEYAGQTITIAYQAELLDSAVMTTDGNPNTAKLEYSNQILPETEDKYNPNKPGTPSNNTISDDAVVYTFKLKVNKVNDSNEALQNVEFDVYRYTGSEVNPTEAELKNNGAVVKHIKTNEAGYADVTGLANGTYYLVETKTNAGYNLLKSPEKVTIAVSYKTTWTETNTYDESRNLVKHDVSQKGETFNHAADTSNIGYGTITIVNKKGFELPTTGGFGTILFSVIGILLMAGGAVVLFRANKKKTA